MICSYYKSATDNIGTTKNVIDILGAIKNGTWQKRVMTLRSMEKGAAYDEYKKGLPGATFSGTFSPSRAEVNLASYNHVVVFDIDKLEASKLMKLMDLLREDPHVLAAFISPGGNGIKGLVPVTSDAAHHKIDAFETLKTYFETNYAVTLDGSGKDTSRLCFVSYDPNLHYNGNAMPMTVMYSAESRSKAYGDKFVSQAGRATTDDRVKYEVAKKWAEYHRPYTEGDRNNHVFICACSMNRVGLELQRAIVLTMADRTDMAVKEIEDCLKRVYQSKKAEFGTISVKDFEAEQEANKDALAADSLEDIYEDVLISIGNQATIEFGDKEIDHAIGGLQGGNLYGFIGPEKTYKSTFAIALATRISEHYGPVAYFSGEMSRKQALRMFLLPYRIDINLETDREVRKDEITALLRGPLRRVKIIDGDGFTKESVILTCDNIKSTMKEPVLAIFIDGLQNWHKIRGTEHEQDSNSTKQMKEVAKQYDVPVVVILHTDARCKPWFRQPSEFVRSKTVVRRNLDAYFDFSRFVDPESRFIETNGAEYELRKDYCHLKVKDQRNGGDTVDRVFAINGLRFQPMPSMKAADLEIKVEQQNNNERPW